MPSSLRARLAPALFALAAVPLLAALGPKGAAAATLTVTADGTGQYPTIQAAINAANNGDTVLVSDGTYTGPGNVDLDFGGRNITVASVNGPAQTIIDCGGSPSANHRGFYLHGGETKAVVSGFTVRDGYETYAPMIPDSGDGGGICVDGSSATIQNCIIEDNMGGGVWNSPPQGGTITLTGCTITGNQTSFGGGIQNQPRGGLVTLTGCTVTGNPGAYDGGGVYNTGSGGGSATTASCNVTMAGCAITDNTAGNGGGGIYSAGLFGGTVTLTNCTVTGNRAMSSSLGLGGGIANFLSSIGGDTVTLTNCTVVGNTAATYGGGVLNIVNGGTSTLTNCTLTGNAAANGGGVFSSTNSTGVTTLTNDIIYGDTGGEISGAMSGSNVTVTHCDVQGGYADTGNLDADPLFANAPADLRLRPGSPCLGAGVSVSGLTTDKDGVTRGNPPAIGAYETAVLPLSRLYDPSNSDHFYTTDPAEVTGAEAAGYVYEGVIGDTPAAAPGTVPVYRSYSPFNAEHFYTVSAAEAQAAAPYGYQPQGVGFYLLAAPATGTEPLWRTYWPAGGRHFYTDSPAEYALVLSAGFVPEGALGYLYP